jgi:hypothetical protein
VNTYDPMDRIVYRHVDQRPGLGPTPSPTPGPLADTPSINQLPAAYANGSPRTYLGRARSARQAA